MLATYTLVTITLPDWPFVAALLLFVVVYLLARTIWRLIPVVGG